MENLEYCESLGKKDRKHYKSKLTRSSGEKPPNLFLLPESDWISDIKLWNIRWKDVTEYLIDTVIL